MNRFLIKAILLCLVAGASNSTVAQKVRLRANINPLVSGCTTGSQRFADIFGEGNVAVMGTYSCRGAFIFDITNPDAPTLASHYNPVRSGTASTTEQFLEAIVLNGRGYFGSGNGGGVYIVDLGNPTSPTLLGVVNPSNGNGHSTIHEMYVFEQNGATYLVENSNSISNKVLKFINVTNPASPVFVRDLIPTEPQWVHAMMVKGNRLVTSGWGNSQPGRTEIYDISNIGTQAPVLQGFIVDPNGASSGNNNHSAWLSEDGNYLYSAREISGTAANGPNAGDIRVFDISVPATPVLMNRLTMLGLDLNAVTPHNPVVMGNKLYISWYQAGMQLFDLTVPTQPNRIGQYDTFQAQFAPEEVIETGEEPWDVFCGRDSFGASVPTGYNGAWAVYPYLGEDRVLIGDLASGLYIVDVTGATAAPRNIISDFDGDGKTDDSTYSPATGFWNVKRSSDGATTSVEWGGFPGDIFVTGDYDGDQLSDNAIFRPSTGTWWFIMSSTGLRPAVQFGQSGDIPVPADYDADGKMDIAVWRPSTGVWYILQSELGIRYARWGSTGDQVFTGDFDIDGKADLVAWRPSTGVWYILRSSSSLPLFYTFGLNGDKPLFADFNGDGRSELAVYRPSTGVWYSLELQSNSFTAYQFGLAEDIPVPADYDGDGKADITVYRPSSNVWYGLNSSNSTFSIRAFGQNGDLPSPSSVQPD